MTVDQKSYILHLHRVGIDLYLGITVVPEQLVVVRYPGIIMSTRYHCG